MGVIHFGERWRQKAVLHSFHQKLAFTTLLVVPSDIFLFFLAPLLRPFLGLSFLLSFFFVLLYLEESSRSPHQVCVVGVGLGILAVQGRRGRRGTAPKLSAADGTVAGTGRAPGEPCCRLRAAKRVGRWGKTPPFGRWGVVFSGFGLESACGVVSLDVEVSEVGVVVVAL